MAGYGNSAVLIVLMRQQSTVVIVMKHKWSEGLAGCDDNFKEPDENLKDPQNLDENEVKKI